MCGVSLETAIVGDKTNGKMPMTFLDEVRKSLAHAARYNPGDVVAPAAVLWNDADGQWWPVAEHLRALMPELLTLGDYDPEMRAHCLINSPFDG